jgi:hypothetical protein
MEKHQSNEAPNKDLEPANELLEEGFLSPEFVEEVMAVLPPPPPPQERPDNANPPKIPDILARRPIKSESFIVLMDPRRSNVYIDLSKGRYSDQKMHEAQYNHLPAVVQELIRFFVKCPYATAVADAEWEAPPKFTLHYTVLSGFENKDLLNGIFANKALFNDGIKFRAPSVELKNLPQTLTKNLTGFMDIADIEALSIKIKEFIDILLFAEKGSEEYSLTMSDLQNLSKGMREKIIELIELVKQADLDYEREELCTIELDYPTWQPKQAWNYLAPWKVMKRRKYNKLLAEILEELGEI